MANEEQLARLKASIAENNGCYAWNQWREEDQWQIKIDLHNAYMSNAYLASADLSEAHLSNIDLTGAHLSDIDFTSAHLSNAHLSGAYLSAAHLSAADFSAADLSAAYLRDADLSVATLAGTRLTNADLGGANLSGANLHDADLRGVRLIGADLNDANLSQANLTGSHLNTTIFSRANLNGANFTDARMHLTNLGNLDLRGVIGLETIIYEGPSHLATDTLYASHGEIPDVFLRGCGLPDEMIAVVHSIAGAIQYYSAFISYNHQDEAFATRLYNDLQANNVRCWKYTEDVKIGHDILARVDEAIRLHEKLVVIFSEHSVQSDWVAAEVEAALAREQREGKEILFPVTIDDAVKHTHFGWAAKIRRQRNIGDFTAWKDQDQYQPRFDRLLRDLKSDSR